MVLVVTQKGATETEGESMFFDDKYTRVVEIFSDDFFEILGSDSVEQTHEQYTLHVSPSVAHDTGKAVSYFSACASAKDILCFTGAVKREIEVCGIALVRVSNSDKQETTLYVVCPEF